MNRTYFKNSGIEKFGKKCWDDETGSYVVGSEGIYDQNQTITVYFLRMSLPVFCGVIVCKCVNKILVTRKTILLLSG